MNRAIFTIAEDPYKEIFDLTSPLFKIYAEEVKADFYHISERLEPARPSGWSKITKTLELFQMGYEIVLYLDSDILILNRLADIFSELSDEYDFGWCVDIFNEMPSPNAGVMLFRNNAATISFLNEVYSQTDLTNDPWWEQIAFMRVLGYLDPRKGSIQKITENKKFLLREKILDNKWNSTSLDTSPFKPNFRHFAGDPPLLRKILIVEYLLRYFSSAELEGIGYDLTELMSLSQLYRKNLGKGLLSVKEYSYLWFRRFFITSKVAKSFNAFRRFL